MKICLVASSGGHLEELAFVKYINMDYDCFLITEKVAELNEKFCDKVYFVDQINRKERFAFFKVLRLFFDWNSDSSYRKAGLFYLYRRFDIHSYIGSWETEQEKGDFYRNVCQGGERINSGKIAYYLQICLLYTGRIS